MDGIGQEVSESGRLPHAQSIPSRQEEREEGKERQEEVMRLTIQLNIYKAAATIQNYAAMVAAASHHFSRHIEVLILGYIHIYFRRKG